MIYAGFLGGPLFLVSLIVFGRLEPGYSHYTKAVSELGAVSVGFGFFGLLLPGLMQAGAGVALHRLAGTRSSAGLVVFGVMNALTAVPADFQVMFRSPWTWAHVVFIMGAPLVLFGSIPGCARSLRRLGASRMSAIVFVVLGYLPLAELLLYGPLAAMPGIVQRITILTTHCATAWLSFALLRLPEMQRSVQQRAE